MGIFDRWKKWRGRQTELPKPGGEHTFRAKYISFKELLSANTELLNIIADLEETLEGGRLFSMAYVRTRATRAVFHAMRMVQGLNFISGQKYLSLMLALDDINKKILSLLDRPKANGIKPFVLSLDRVNKEMLDWVGGKSAHLGEMHSVMRLPVPPGFAITTHAFEHVMSHHDLGERIAARLREMDPNVLSSIAGTSAALQTVIKETPLPPDLAQALQSAARQLADRLPTGSTLRLAMRSSAVGEDGELSFAGQYRTLLNVDESMITDSYRSIAASLYTERAMMYRLSKGIREQDIAMGVTCLQMVSAKASGVVYSRNPADPRLSDILISAVWGLGPYAVEGGIAPDQYAVARGRPPTVVKTVVAHKPVKLVCAPDTGVHEQPVDAALVDAPCLKREQLLLLAEYAVVLEDHYGLAQDMEWALDDQDRILIVQTRSLAMAQPDREKHSARALCLDSYRLLSDQGAPAFAGIGCGPVRHINTDRDLSDFPEGAVLVAGRASPRFVLAMPRARAIVVEVGSVTGHMASLCREFRVPALLNVPNARTLLEPGMQVTVDAYAGTIYRGCVEPLLALEPPARQPGETPAYKTLRQVADLIVPLNLTDPKAPAFRPSSCRTLHDIMRMVHELCYQEMFRISDHVSYSRGAAVKLDMQLPVDLFLIDLGDGLAANAAANGKIPADAVRCVPLRALLKGMLHKDVCRREPRPVALSGFLSVMREQMLSPPARIERFGDRSYAVVSDKYMNFSSRVGYHYSILDCYCGATLNKNYITFAFKGGAADDVRRNRRVRAIAAILEALDFSVDVRGDRVDARLLKYDQDVIAQRLDQIGRLLQFTRQMDMLMNAESSVETVAQCFLSGNYHLEQKPVPQ